MGERPTPAPRTPEWFAADARRNEAAVRERLRADGDKPLGQNLEEGVRLIELGFELLGAAGGPMKRAADRPQDRLDLEQLAMTRGEEPD